jgi:hypothetical protein
VLDLNKLKATLQRAKTKLAPEHYEILQAVADSYAHIAELACEPGMTMDRLRELSLGSGAEQSEA